MDYIYSPEARLLLSLGIVFIAPIIILLILARLHKSPQYLLLAAGMAIPVGLLWLMFFAIT